MPMIIPSSLSQPGFQHYLPPLAHWHTLFIPLAPPSQSLHANLGKRQIADIERKDNDKARIDNNIPLLMKDVLNFERRVLVAYLRGWKASIRGTVGEVQERADRFLLIMIYLSGK